MSGASSRAGGGDAVRPVTPTEMQRLALVLAHAHAARRRAPEDLARLHRGFLARDEKGRLWTVGLRSRRWSRLERANWVEAPQPPTTLTLDAATQDEIAALAPQPRRDARAENEPPRPTGSGPGAAARASALERLQRADHAGAEIEYGRAIEVDPQDAAAFLGRGYARSGLRKFRPALEDHRRAAQLQPGWAECHLAVGQSLHWLDEYEEALAAFDRAIKITPGYDLALSARTKTLEARKARNTVRLIIGLVIVAALAWWFRDHLLAFAGIGR